MEELRRGTASDASAIRELTRAAYAKWAAMIGREPKPMRADYERAVNEHLIDLLCVDDEIVALIETVPEAGCLLIENIAVAPALQGRGYGRRLMAHAERLAVSLGLTTTRLYTNKLFEANIRLYERLGYRRDKDEAFAGGILVHMSKALAAPSA